MTLAIVRMIQALELANKKLTQIAYHETDEKKSEQLWEIVIDNDEVIRRMTEL